MPAPFQSETAKVREMPHVMQHIRGRVLDYGCGGDKINSKAIGLDGRDMPGVNLICADLEDPTEEIARVLIHSFDTVYSSHFLEHCREPFNVVSMWYQFLMPGGTLVLYLPDGRHYSNEGNPEHMQDINHDNFMFWFRRNFCGEGKNYKGEHVAKFFELIDHGMDVGDDRYSFYLIARAT